MSHYSHVSMCVPLHFLFSATWPDGVRRLAKSYLKNPMIVYVGTLDLAVSCPILFLVFSLPFVESTLKPATFLLVTNYASNQSELPRNSCMLFILNFP